MTYYIYYLPKTGNSVKFTLFDIEYYKKQSNKDKSKWYSEISCLPRIEGLTRFLKEKFKDNNFDYEQFIKDAKEIQEIRGLLYEKYDNKPKSKEESNEFHYNTFGELLRNKLEGFVKKYSDLYIDID